jgi:hypothetical protein
VQIRHYPVTVNAKSLNQLAGATGVRIPGRLFKIDEA